MKNDGNDTNEEGTKAALLEALSDSSLEVATVLYDVKNRSKLASICASEADAVYQRCLSDSPSDVDGNLIVKRADFLVNTFAGVVDENWRIRILTEYLWPHLLATKHSLNKTNGIWDVVIRSDKKTWPVFKAARESVLTTEEDAITFNDKLVDMLCKIWYTDDASQAQFTRFLSASVARNTSAHGKASTLSQLVVLRLLAGGDCKYALAVLEHLPVGSALAAASSLYGTSKLPTVLARRLWSKYASPKTQNALAGAVFGTALHAVAASKPTAEWSWLAASADLSKEIKQHRALINRVYEVSHSTQIPDECRRRVIETLLTVQLRADVLAFLAGIYTTGAEGIRSIALRDVAMFIEQHSNLDYQVLLPSLVQALAVGKRVVCQEALRVLHAMQNAITDGNSEGLYGLDTFYGVFSGKRCCSEIPLPAILTFRCRKSKVLGQTTIFFSAAGDPPRRSVPPGRWQLHATSLRQCVGSQRYRREASDQTVPCRLLRFAHCSLAQHSSQNNPALEHSAYCGRQKIGTSPASLD